MPLRLSWRSAACRCAGRSWGDTIRLVLSRCSLKMPSEAASGGPGGRELAVPGVATSVPHSTSRRGREMLLEFGGEARTRSTSQLREAFPARPRTPRPDQAEMTGLGSTRERAGFVKPAWAGWGRAGAPSPGPQDAPASSPLPPGPRPDERARGRGGPTAGGAVGAAPGSAGQAPGTGGAPRGAATALHHLRLYGRQAGGHGGRGPGLLGRHHTSVPGGRRGPGGRRILDRVLPRSDRRPRDSAAAAGRAPIDAGRGPPRYLQHRKVHRVPGRPDPVTGHAGSLPTPE